MDPPSAQAARVGAGNPPSTAMSSHTSAQYTPLDAPFGDSHEGNEKSRAAVSTQDVGDDGFAYGQLRSPRVLLWLPAFAAALASFGLLCAMLSWLLSRRIHDHLPSEDSQFRRAIVVLEGPSTPPAVNADGTIDLDSTLYGLTISTIATTVVFLTTPIVVGVFALRLAKDWIRAQEEQRRQDLPTAAQYGLLMKLCTSVSLMSLIESGMYLRQRRVQGGSTSPVLLRAMLVVLLTLTLAYALNVVDIWLHSTSTVFLHTEIHNATQDILPYLGSDVNLTACPGPTLTLELYELVPPPGYDNYTNCAHYGTPSRHGQPVEVWGTASELNEGLLALKNESYRYRAVLVDEYAVLVAASPPPNMLNMTFDTFAISSTCEPITNCIMPEGDPTFTLSCPGLNVAANNSFDLNITSTVQGYNVTANKLGDTSISYGFWGYHLGTVLNPYGALVTLGFLDEDGTSLLLPARDTPGWYIFDESGFALAYYYASCTVTAWNVTVSYSSARSAVQDELGTYTFASAPVMSNFNTTSALFAALDYAYVQNLASYLQDTLTPALNTSTDVFSTLLSQNMSFAMASMASPLLEPVRAARGALLAQRVASRYGAGALGTYVALLGAYSLLCAVLGVLGARATSRELRVRGADPAAYTEAEHVHLRLSDPLVVVAERFAGPERQGRMLAPSALDMFDDGPVAPHLAVFVEGPGDAANAPLGLFRRRTEL